MKVCPKCGNLVADNLNFCMKCGTSVQFPAPQPKVQPQQPKAEFPVNNAFVPQVKQEKKKKPQKKNGAVRIIAIILAVILLLGGVAALIIGIGNSNETKGEGVKYIEDFPVLKNAIELTVYDADIFPVEEYEIKVEKFAVGGALKDISTKKEILDEISSQPVYDLNLEDGSYRITLTDMAEAEEDTTAESASEDSTQTQDEVFKKVVIDVRVDENDEKATDKADLKSTGAEVEGSYNMIEATDEDFEEFLDWVNCCSFNSYAAIDFDHKTATTKFVIDKIILPHYIGGYEYYFGRTEFLSQAADPLSEYTQLGFWKIPEENIRWICENIYNIQYEPVAEDVICDSQMHYVHDGYFYHRDPAFGDAGWFEAEIVKHTVVNGRYEIVVKNYSCYEDWEGNGEINRDLHVTAKITAEIKVIDGERYWSIYKIEEYDPSADTQQSTQPTVNKLSADDIINVYMSNKSVWYRDFENFDCDGSASFYTFMDLDFDGIP